MFSPAGRSFLEPIGHAPVPHLQASGCALHAASGPGRFQHKITCRANVKNKVEMGFQAKLRPGVAPGEISVNQPGLV
ncbi:MAG: hypothetical protein D6814_01085 [Calditrichaeota bacterium]|nr:MAG: hypothetical protein D6814_01085 [Calditrichota bacterium]